jgi:LPS sulfotransferase NodH
MLQNDERSNRLNNATREILAMLAIASGAKYVVLTRQRCGSSWVMEVLNRQNGSEAFGELFLGRPRSRPELFSNEYPRFVEWNSGSRLPRRMLVFRYCDGLYARPGAVGFKLMYSQLASFPELLLYFKARRIQIIHLVRDDLDVVISGAVLAASGVAHIREGDEPVRIEPITLDPKKVVQRIRKLRSRRSILRTLLSLLKMPIAEFSYESLVSNPSSVATYLGIDFQQFGSSLTKTVQSRTAAVSNLRDIEEAAKQL